MYADYTDYLELYGMDGLKEADFPLLSLEAEMLMDRYTTGVDNVMKLKRAFPTDDYTVRRIKACFCALVDFLYQVGEAEKSATLARGYQQTEEGMRGKVISSRSAGNESISYSTSGGNSVSTAFDKAISDQSERTSMIYRTIVMYLSGLTDANGVNLMYMGRYPLGSGV